jgi:hypothetical protein
MKTPSSVPFPTFNSLIRFVRASANSSYIPFCTMMRLAVTQVCPEFLNFARRQASTAVSILASSNTMNGLFPPSSRLSFFKLPAHCCASSFPTFVLPVKLNFFTSLFVQSSWPTSATSSSVVTTLIAPLGNPASCARTACARQLSGVSPAGFQTSQRQHLKMRSFKH